MIRKIYLFTSFLSLFVQFCYGALFIDTTATTVIEGKQSGVCRPEGIAFSPEGDYIVATGSSNDTLCFYNRITDGVYETTPSYVIQDKHAKLRYPHDIAFSPDGQHLAVANRRGNNVAIFKKSNVHSFFDPTPIAIIEGVKSQLTLANAVKYSPVSNSLIVADPKKHALNFYFYDGDTYEVVPYQVIKNRGLLVKPDGLAYSHDGQLLAVTSHGVHKVLLYKQDEDRPGYFSSTPVEVIEGEETALCYPHSLFFHPSDYHLIVSNAGAKKSVCLFEKTADSFFLYHKTPIQILEIYNPETIHLQQLSAFKEEGGVKGIVFNQEGDFLALCASDIACETKTIMCFRLFIPLINT